LTVVKLAWAKDREIHPERNPVLILFRRWFRVADTYTGPQFFIKQQGRWVATPLVVVLLIVEWTDLVFAIDSIPAILAITRDPFIVYTSNVFAILGLRALYFALAGLMHKFHHLHYGLAAILVFVGVKMVLSGVIKVPMGLSLGVIGLILWIAIAASWWWPPAVNRVEANSSGTGS